MPRAAQEAVSAQLCGEATHTSDARVRTQILCGVMSLAVCRHFKQCVLVLTMELKHDDGVDAGVKADISRAS